MREMDKFEEVGNIILSVITGMMPTENASLQICALFAESKSTSLRQPSPFREVASFASGETVATPYGVNQKPDEGSLLTDEELGAAVRGKWNSQHLRVAQAQNAKSYAAGFAEGQADPRHNRALLEKEMKGRREVVEWIESKAFRYTDSAGFVRTRYPFTDDEWKAQLRAWGLEKGQK